MPIRQATSDDVEAIAATYDELLSFEAVHGSASNWQAGVYPTLATAADAVEHGWMYVDVEDGRVVASMILNSLQAPEYADVPWLYPAEPEDVLVVHTLAVPPSAARHGYGRAMLDYALGWGRSHGMTVCRLDTWAENKPAQTLYLREGFRLAGSGPMRLAGLIEEEQVFLERRL